MLKFDKQVQAGRYHKHKSSGGFQGKESELEKACEQLLDTLDIAYIRIPDAVYRAIFGNSYIKPYIKKLISKFLKGVPDITILFDNGRFAAVELKNAKGKQSQGQKKFERKTGEKNYFIVRSFDEFKDLIFSLKDWSEGTYYEKRKKIK